MPGNAPKTPINKAYLHGFKLLNLYNSRLSALAHIYEYNWEIAWKKENSPEGKDNIDINKQWKMLVDSGINTVCIQDQDYPSALKNITDPPLLLYYKGALAFKPLSIAIVGSRNATDYGQQAVNKLVKELANLELGIVSGLAYGIDQYAHEAALQNNIATYAVLGSGLDHDSIYPSSNAPLAQKIIDCGGALISEYPPGTQSRKQYFPLRNRIISGLCAATVVIEAAAKSGALLTAKYALAQGKDLYAMPGSIFNWSSEGSNDLLKKGAKVITTAADLIKNYPLLKAPPRRAGIMAFSLSADAEKIFSIFKESALTFAQIRLRANIDVPRINSAISELLLNDLIKETASGLFLKT